MPTFRHSENPRPSRFSRITAWQWAVLVVEAVLSFGVLGVLGWMMLLGGPASGPDLAAAVLTPTPAGPGAMPTSTPTPFAWATPLPTRTPLPTNTRVISRASTNQEAIREIEQQVVSLRGLRPRADVQSDLFTRDEMMDYIRKGYGAEQAEMDKRMALYQALGLVRPGVQIDPDRAAKIIAANIAGFYRPEDKHLYVISDMENLSADDKIVLAHEYTHALQDQSFDLEKYRARIHTTDAGLAMMALPEGDATVVMSLYLYGNTTRGEWEYLTYRAAFSDRSVITATELSTRTGEIQYFPYMQGAQFVVALVQDGRGWAEVNHAYADPPQTTSQVMHPAQYLTTHATPVPVALPDLGPALGTGWSPLVKADSLGEFVTSVHVDEFLHDAPRAAQAAEGWDGDNFTLWQAPGERQAFAWQLAWATPRDRNEFFDAYSDLLRRRVGSSAIVTREQTDLHWYSGSAGSGLVRRSNGRTLVLWGPDRATVDKMMGVFR